MTRLGLGKTELKQGQKMYDPSIVSEILDNAIASWIGNNDDGLTSIIDQDSKVVIKPSFVNHRNKGNEGLECLITNQQVIIEVLKKVAACNPKQIILGDAPIQGCVWEKLVTNRMRNDFQNIVGIIPFQIKDFRRTVYNSGAQMENIVPESEFILFDLNEDSYLEEVSDLTGRFRVSMYDHRKLNKTHCKGKHQYLIAKDLIDADVVISIPKLKTHKKAGLTGALKNLVGINGNKEYLPHHRKGGTLSGGDCYPGSSIVKSVIENLDDLAYMCANEYLRKCLVFCKRSIFYVYRKLGGDESINGNWYGNNTVWRTILDLNRILYFGTKDAQISSKQQRKIISITDAIICGEGDGPLSPEPLPIGVITVTNRPDVADYFHARLLGMKPEQIQLIANAKSLFGCNTPEQIKIVFNGCEYEITDSIFEFPAAKMPKGWMRD